MNTLQHLKGKKILFFCMRLFDLERDIIHQLEKHGAEVTYYDERPANTIFTKGIIRINKKFLSKRIKEYYQRIFQEIETKKFDYLLVIRGEVITNEFLEKFIAAQPDCERIFYSWDSIKNHNYLHLLHFFNKRFTFDRNDAKDYGIGFRPLYFTDRYKKISKNINKKYDLLFLGTAHSDRYIISNKISEMCIKNNLSSFCFYYMHGKITYFYKRLFDKSFKKFDFRKISFDSLSSQDVINLYSVSNVILDINHPNQTGLTMRTFETVGARRKLITTNKDVVTYPFYNETNVFIVDRDKIDVDISFFKTEYQELDAEVYYKCSIDAWLEHLFLRDEESNWLL